MLPVVMGVAQSDWITVSIWAGTVAAVVIAVDGTWGLYKARRMRIDSEKNADIEKAILSVLTLLSDSIEISIIHLGGSVFRYKKRWRSFRLKSLLRYRLDDYPGQSGFKWTGAKGAIGVAAETKRVVHCDWVEASTALHAGRDPLPLLPEEKRFGFSNEQLLQMVEKYFESLATPIMSGDGSRVLGILAIDIPNRPKVQYDSAMLGARDIEELTVRAAAVIARALER